MIFIIAIVIPICLYFIHSAFWARDKLLTIGIGGSTLLLYVLLHFIIPITPAADYASDFLGASFPVELVLCAIPSILILGIAGMIDSLKWKIKEIKRGANKAPLFSNDSGMKIYYNHHHTDKT